MPPFFAPYLTRQKCLFVSVNLKYFDQKMGQFRWVVFGTFQVQEYVHNKNNRQVEMLTERRLVVVVD